MEEWMYIMCEGIIKRAIEDYRSAMKEKYRCDEFGKKLKPETEYAIRSCERFFLGDMGIYNFSEADGRKVMDMVRKEAREEYEHDKIQSEINEAKKFLKKYRIDAKKKCDLLERKKIIMEEIRDLEVTTDRVQCSSHDFPYIEEHISIQSVDIEKKEKLVKELREVKNELHKILETEHSVQEYIESIQDRFEREIMTECLVKHKRQQDVARKKKCSHTKIAKIIRGNITKYLKTCKKTID